MDTGRNRDEPWEHFQWKKLETSRPPIVWLHLYEISKEGKSIETLCKLVIARGWELEIVEQLLFGDRVSFGGDGNLETDWGSGCTILWMYQMPLHFPFKKVSFMLHGSHFNFFKKMMGSQALGSSPYIFLAVFALNGWMPGIRSDFMLDIPSFPVLLTTGFCPVAQTHQTCPHLKTFAPGCSFPRSSPAWLLLPIQITAQMLDFQGDPFSNTIT